MTTTPTTAEILAALDQAQDAAIESGAYESYSKVRAAFQRLRGMLATPAEIAQPATPEPADTDLLSQAAQFLEWYADWIKRKAMSADIEEHPYLPELEDVAERLRAQASAPSVQVVEPLTDDECDRIAAQTLDRVAAAKGLEHATYLNTDISVSHTLRRELIRAGLAQASALQAAIPAQQPAEPLVWIEAEPAAKLMPAGWISDRGSDAGA